MLKRHRYLGRCPEHPDNKNKRNDPPSSPQPGPSHAPSQGHPNDPVSPVDGDDDDDAYSFIDLDDSVFFINSQVGAGAPQQVTKSDDASQQSSQPNSQQRDNRRPNHEPLEGDDDLQTALNAHFQGVEPNIRNAYIDHWTAIRAWVTRGPNQVTFNVRWDDPLANNAPDWQMLLRARFDEQRMRFKINYSHSYLLVNQNTQEIKFFHSCSNNARVLEHPVTINDLEDWEAFLRDLGERSHSDLAKLERPDSQWSFVCITSTTFFINPIPLFPIGTACCSKAAPVPHLLKNNRYICTLTTDPKRGGPYTDRLCFFRGLAMHQGATRKRLEVRTKELYQDWTLEPLNQFQGIKLTDLPALERRFGVSVDVFDLDEEGKFLYPFLRSKSNHPKMRLILHEDHFMYITSLENATDVHVCNTCGMLWHRRWNCTRHQDGCKGVEAEDVYPGGVYTPGDNPLAILADNGITVPEQGYIYPFRACYDFESMMLSVQPGERKNTSTTQYTARHLPLSVSVCSNVPGFEEPTCLVTKGDTEADAQNLINEWLDYLHEVADHSFTLLKEQFAVSYDDIEALHDTPAASRSGKGPKYLKQVLDTYLHQLPVVGFNSSSYDLNVIKPFIFQYLTARYPQVYSHEVAPGYDSESDEGEEERVRREDEAESQDARIREEPDTAAKSEEHLFVIKTNNVFKLVQTHNLRFLDVKAYLAPGYSYASYLKAFDVEEQKGFFPYEYLTSVTKLAETELPPKEAFHSSLRNTDISDQDYALCQRMWQEQGMSTLRDFLVAYNNLDVKPFLVALERQTQFYKELGLDMLKDGIGLPALCLKYLFSSMSPEVYISLFNTRQQDLAEKLRANIVGGPSLVFTRLLVKDQTPIRGGDKVVKSVIGLDANALYLGGMMEEQPTMHPLRRRAENNFVVEEVDRYGTQAREWLTWVSHREGVSIRTKFTHSEKRLGTRKLPVDGWCADESKVYQYHGCVHHGHRCRLTAGRTVHPLSGKPLVELWDKTRQNTDYLKSLGLTVVEMTECEWLRLKGQSPTIQAFVSTHCPTLKSPFPWTGAGVNVRSVCTAIQQGKLFGLVECDIHTPEHLKPKFEEFQPIFKNITIGRDQLSEHMREYVLETGTLKQPRRTLIASFHGEKILLTTPLLKWYLEQGLIVTAIYDIVEYFPHKCFLTFGNTVTEKRVEADADKSNNKQIIAMGFKALGNSSYGKTLTNIERFTETKYMHPDKAAKLIRKPQFKAVREMSPSLQEVQLSKKKVCWNLPAQIGFFTYCYAKLRMLRFYHEVLDYYVDRTDYELGQMDTDSLYFGLSGESLESVIKPEKKEEFFLNHSDWFPAKTCDNHKPDYIASRLNPQTAEVNNPPTWNEPCCVTRRQRDKRKPNLFKEEYKGEGIIALCSKTYYCFGEQDKYSSKGLQGSNNLTKDRYLTVLQSRQSGGGVNRGFRTSGRQMYTYSQHRRALSYLYIKRPVRPDGIHTDPTPL